MIYPDRTPESIESACYCEHCTTEFSSATGIVIPDSCTTPEQRAARQPCQTANRSECVFGRGHGGEEEDGLVNLTYD